MSPEQAERRIADLDERSDIFSLGAILYAILTLHPPVEGKMVGEVLRRISSGQIAPPSNFGAKSESKGKASTKGEILDARVFRPLPHCPSGRVPSALSAVTMKALSVDKARRYQSVNEFSAEVEAWQSGFATRAENASLGRQLVLLIQRHSGVFATAFAAWLIITALAVWFVIGIRARERRAVQGELAARIERDRANATLTELRGTAPTFVAQAKALADAGKLDDALAKLGYAVQLDPKNPAFQLQRAHLLEAGQHLAEAAAAYRGVLSLDPDNRSARDNLALCERLLSENGGVPQLRRELQVQLVDALVREGRSAEAGALSAQLGQGGAAIEATLRARLKEYTAQPGWNEDRIRQLPNGTFSVSLGRMKLGDLSVLRGLPISELQLYNTDLKDLRVLAGLHLTSLNCGTTQVTDLSLLRGLKLERLYCGFCRVGDIEPLRGMPLRTLDLTYTQVSDLSVLAGMPLEDLRLARLFIKSLRPLRGLPLRHLELIATHGDTDMANLAECRELEDIELSKYAANIEALRTLPKLARLRQEGYQDALVTAEKFWAGFKPEMEAAGTILLGLKNAELSSDPSIFVALLPDHTVQMGLGNSSVRDLGFLHGMPVSQLLIYGTKVHDLTPLRGLPLKSLNASSCPITDIEPLRGLPLTDIYLGGAPIASLAPLQDCPTLEIIGLPRVARDIEMLRGLPKLRLLSYEWDSQTNLPTKTAEQFWKEYDANHPTTQK